MAVMVNVVLHIGLITILFFFFSHRKKKRYIGGKNQYAYNSDDVLNHNYLTI